MKERGRKKQNVVGGRGCFKIIVKGQIMITKINPGNPYREQ